MVGDDAITVSPRAEPVAPAPSALRTAVPIVVVVAGYVLIGIVAYWHAIPGMFRQPVSGQVDYILSAWFLGWVPHALGHGLDPFFSNALYVPTGINLAQNTESPLLGLISAPIALVSSPVTRTNLLMVLSMPASATAAFVVLRKWRVWGPAAALGGLVYGFSPYMVGQGLSHVVFVFVPLPPFIALTLASIVQRRGTPRRLGLQLGLLVSAQFLISPEVLAGVGILAIVAVVCLAIRTPADAGELVRTVARPAGYALVVMAVLLAYPVWMLLAGPQHFTGPTRPLVNPFHNDVLGFLAPGPLQRFSFGMRSLGNRLVGAGDPVEANGYIGIPVLLLTALLGWRSRRSPRMQLSILLLLVAALLSLGPYLVFNGHQTRIPLPFFVLAHIPLLDNILPARVGFEVSACIAAVLAFGLDDVRRSPSGRRHTTIGGWWTRRRMSAALALATLAVLVATQLPEWPYAAPRTFTTLPAALRRAIPTGHPVTITYPYASYYTGLEPLLWQTEDGYSFRLLGGYGYHPSSSGHQDVIPSLMRPAGTQQFLVGQQGILLYGAFQPVSPELVRITRSTVARYHIRLVIVDRSLPGSGDVMLLFEDALGPPKISAAHLSLWADWHGYPTHEIFPSLVTTILRPRDGSTVSGTTTLDAAATDYHRVTGVEFLLTGGGHLGTPIATAHLTFGGWVATWNTTTLANGTYTLRTVARDSAGRTSLSAGTTVTVQNHRAER